MKAWCWSAVASGSSFYRSETVAAALAQRGHQIGLGQQIDPAWLDSDAIIGQRLCTAGPTLAAIHLHQQGVRLVDDFDDDLFAIEPTNVAAWRYFHRFSILTRVAAVAYCADTVTVCTDVLAGRMRRHADNVHVIPNGLPAAVLDWPGPWDKPARPPTIGLVATESTYADVASHPQALAAALNCRTPGRRVHVIGLPAQVASKQLGLYGRGVHLREWVRSGWDYLHAIDFDMWIAPYRDTAFNRAKFPTKALEAAFLGIPVVASAIGPYVDFVEHGVTGFLVDDPGEWAGYVNELASDVGLRHAMGKAARQQAAAWTVEGFVPLWERAMGMQS